MTPALRATLIAGIQDGSIVPYLGCGVLADVRHTDTGAAIPADSDSLILAMNNGRPMSPKLMYEFPRAAMNVELKRGRGAVLVTCHFGNWDIGARTLVDALSLTLGQGELWAVLGPNGVVGRVVVAGPRASRVQLLVDRNAAAGALVVGAVALITTARAKEQQQAPGERA